MSAVISVVACQRLGCDETGKVAAPPLASTPPAEGSGQQFDSPDGLVTLHYPAEFNESPIGQRSMLLSHNLPSGRDEAISFVILEYPASNDLTEFAKGAERGATAEISQKRHYVERQRTPTTCNGVAGIETKGSWVGVGGRHYLRRACAILRDGHGYLFSYSVSTEDVADREPILRSIVEATTFHAK